MGKSDPHIFKAYKSFFDYYTNYKKINKNFEDVCFLGQDKENAFTQSIPGVNRDFYDISLENWNINNFPYDFKNKYDLIVCTRCPYFSNNPKKFLSELNRFLKPGGRVFLDWGLGDHLRYKKFRVGFEDSKEKEQCYFEGNYMSSCVWDKSFAKQEGTKIFKSRIEKYGYSDLEKAIIEEVPVVLTLEDLDLELENISVYCHPLWEEMPQLYIIVQGTKK